MVIAIGDLVALVAGIFVIVQAVLWLKDRWTRK